MIFGQKIYCLMSKNVIKISIISSANNYNDMKPLFYYIAF